jgi:hypothetical protein
MLSGEPRKPQLELTITIFLQKAYLNFTKQCIEWSSIVYFIYINLIREAVLDVHDFANIRRDSRECDVFFVAISKWEEYLAFRLLCDIRCSPKTVFLARYFFSTTNINCSSGQKVSLIKRSSLLCEEFPIFVE